MKEETEFVVEQVTEVDFEKATERTRLGISAKTSKYDKVMQLVLERQKPFTLLFDDKKKAERAAAGIRHIVKRRKKALVSFCRGVQVWIAPKSLYDSVKAKVENS